MPSPTHTPPPPWRRPRLIGLALGLGVTLFDLVLLLATDVQLRLGDTDITLPAMLGYGVSTAALGYAIGWIVEARVTLRESQERLAQAEKLAAIGRMAAQVAHEVRNPLGVIRSSAALVRDAVPSEPDLEQACTFIVEEVDRLDAYVTRLLDYSRPITPDVEAVDAASVADRALELAGPRLAEREVVRQDAPPAQRALRADADLLTRVVLGLLVNAAQATEPEGRIEVRTGRADGDVWIEVADDGPGVASDTAPQLFEPFFTTKAQGSGLGLAVAERIARAHGGAVALLADRGAGAAGAGACFRLSLPAPGVAA